MNRRPIAYLQTDPRWAALPYRVPGERATIGGSGCGPTAAAMLIETLTGKTFTPVDACAWSVDLLQLLRPPVRRIWHPLRPAELGQHLRKAGP